MRRLIIALVNDNSGILNRISGVLTRRQFNINSISVGATENPAISRISLVVEVERKEEVEQIIKQLNKQIDVIKVSDISEDPHIERELALVQVSVSPANRSEIFSLIEPFRGNVIDVGAKSITIQVTGTSEKIEAFVDVIQSYGILQLARTGVTGFTRGVK